MMFLILLTQLAAAATLPEYGPGKNDNLAPYASMDLSKRKMIDVNIFNDETTGYSMATLNSKVNEMIKPKLAQEGVDFKVNVISSEYKNIYAKPVGDWECVANSSQYHYDSYKSSTSGINILIKISNNLIRWSSSSNSGDLYSQTNGLDFDNYIYKVTVSGEHDKANTTNTKEYYKPTTRGSDDDNCIIRVDNGSYSTISVYRAKKIAPTTTFKYQSDSNYYIPDFTYTYDNSKNYNPGSIYGSISISLLDNNRMLIHNFSSKNIGTATYSDFYATYYSDYNKKKIIGKSYLFRATSSYEGGGFTFDYPSNAVAFDIGVEGRHYMGEYEWDMYGRFTGGYTFYDSALSKNGESHFSDGKEWEWLELNIGTFYIKRPSFISENSQKTTWREGAEKYYVSLSNNKFAENLYPTGKGRSLQILLEKDISVVRMSNVELKDDFYSIVKSINYNGKFIDNSNLNTSFQKLSNYVTNKNTNVYLDLIIQLGSSNKSALEQKINEKLIDYLDGENINLHLNLIEGKKKDPDVYSFNRFYFAEYGYINDKYSLIIKYYNEDDGKVYSTSAYISLDNSSNTPMALYMTDSGSLLVVSTNYIREFVPNGTDLIEKRNCKIYAYDNSYYIKRPCYALNDENIYLYGVSFYSSSKSYLFRFDIPSFQLVPAKEGEVPTPMNEDYIKTVNNTYQYWADDTYKYVTLPNGSSISLGYKPDWLIGNSITQKPIYIPEPLNESIDKIPVIEDVDNKYLVFLSDNSMPEFDDSTTKSTFMSKLSTAGYTFVGMGRNTNSETMQNIISSAGKGKYIDNNNIDTAISELASYIKSLTVKPSNTIENGSYIVVSENETPIEFEAGGLDDSTGVQAINPGAVRSKEYITASNSGNYTISKNGSDIDTFKIYCYDTNLNLVSTPIWLATDNRFSVPLGTCYIKLQLSTANTTAANRLTIIDNSASSGESIEYKPNVTDSENDTADIVFKFDHDNKNIAGAAITNPSDKLTLSGVELSAPIERFTKPGTYKISMYAKDIPKQIADSTNLLPNGDAETVDSSGKLSDWSTWAENSAITNFTRTTTADWKIIGNGSFEISTSSGAAGANSACYYKDLAVSPNTSYKLSGLLLARKCSANFVVYEMDDNYNILKSISTNEIVNNAVPQESFASFTTSFSTTKLRVHILKGGTTNYVAGARDYIFADNITLTKLLPDSRFNEYRKTSKPATATIYAHRLPRAEFTYQIENSAGSFKIKNLADNQFSYDPDHTDKANKGIINSQWRWAEIKPDGTTTWYDGKVPEATTFSTGTQILMWYRVQDSDGPNGIGAWSMPKVVSTDGSLADPVALFTAAPNPLPMQNELTITDQSYSTNFGGTITSRTWTMQKLGSAAQTLSFDRSDTTNNRYYKTFRSLGFGKYTITLTVTDSYGKVSKPYSQAIDVIDNINPTVSANPASGTFSEEGGATITVTCNDSTQSTTYNRGLKTIDYVWSKNATQPQSADTVSTINISSEKTYTKSFTASQAVEGTWYLYVKAVDYAGNTSNGDSYTRFGPYTVETLRAGHFYVTMMLDVGWRSYYFDVDRGIDDNHDGEIDRYPRRANTDIGTLKLPINYFNLVGHDRTYIKAGYKVKGKIDIIGNPDWAKFGINYIIEGKTYTDTVALTKSTGDTYTFEWIIPLETDNKTFVSFDLVTKKGNKTYGNEKWTDVWDSRNTSRLVFYVKGKATDDLIYVQSQ